MKKFLSIALAAVVMTACNGTKTETEPQKTAKVKPGIEVLRDNGFESLKGKRVGLITNPTGVDNDLKSTIDILHDADSVELVALFSPEHGVRGNVHAGDTVSTYIDPATGVTVYSIYGKTKKPTAEMLKDVDVLLYDIQDNGCRSFTFISTMGLAMDACAEQGKEFMEDRQKEALVCRRTYRAARNPLGDEGGAEVQPLRNLRWMQMAAHPL